MFTSRGLFVFFTFIFVIIKPAEGYFGIFINIEKKKKQRMGHA
jgi:hypothetical protein